MITILLIEKICSLFLILILGFLTVRIGLLKSEDSRILSVIIVYIIIPCTILNAFLKPCTPESRQGLMLAFLAAIGVHLLWLLMITIFGKLLHLDPVEITSIMYPNAANLIIPIVISILGDDMVIYTTAFIAVQLLLIWSHGKTILCGEPSIDWKKVFTNINLIFVFLGLFLFFFPIPFPAVVLDSISSLSAMIGPCAMLITGMLIGGQNLKKALLQRRVWFITLMRLVVFPLPVLLLLKLALPHLSVPNASSILLITLLATTTPSANSVTQMAQVFGKDATLASIINVQSTILCILTMPIMVFLYQL